MNSRPLIVKLTGLFVLIFAAATSSRANSVIVRGGSAYGDGSDSTYLSCAQNIVNDLDGTTFSNCEGYMPGAFTIGSNTYNGDLFSFVSSTGTDFGTIDVLLLPAGTLSTPSVLSLNLANFTDPTGLFLCGSNGESFASSSDTSPLTGLYCTTGGPISGDSGVQDVAGVTATFSLTGVTFTNANGASDPIAVFTSDGNIEGATFTPGSPVTTPEPSSFILLGLGLLAIGWKFKSVQPGARSQTSV
jgi:PEP-CTERM motif